VLAWQVLNKLGCFGTIPFADVGNGVQVVRLHRLLHRQSEHLGA
jgi:hypothetical protein